MKTLVNKTFAEISLGDSVSSERELQATDLRAWANAFGESDPGSIAGASQGAVDSDAARIKHIVSPVAGIADVLLAPNIEAGNLVYKNLGFMADAQTAGLVVGARVPIILTSRADTAASRRFSAAAAVLYDQACKRDPTILHPEVAE